MSITYTELYSKVEKMIKPSRFQHSVDVAKTAAMLAERFGLDKDAALIAGIPTASVYRHRIKKAVAEYNSAAASKPLVSFSPARSGIGIAMNF